MSEPALTPEEWWDGGLMDPDATATSAGVIVGYEDWAFDDPVGSEYRFVGRKAHALAALCLHGQPFGFTWEDVDLLLHESNRHRRFARNNGDPNASERNLETARGLESLADRIAALLPPREGT